MSKSDTTTITLRHPVERGGQKHATLVMRWPTVGDVRGAHRAAAPSTLRSDIEAHLFAHLLDVDVAVIDLLRIADYEQLQDAYEDFRSRGSTSTARGS